MAVRSFWMINTVVIGTNGRKTGACVKCLRVSSERLKNERQVRVGIGTFRLKHNRASILPACFYSRAKWFLALTRLHAIISCLLSSGKMPAKKPGSQSFWSNRLSVSGSGLGQQSAEQNLGVVKLVCWFFRDQDHVRGRPG